MSLAVEGLKDTTAPAPLQNKSVNTQSFSPYMTVICTENTLPKDSLITEPGSHATTFQICY